PRGVSSATARGGGRPGARRPLVRGRGRSRLPLARVRGFPPAPPLTALSRFPPAADRSRMSGLTAIVGDDDPESRKSTCTLASTCGFEIVAELDLAVSAVTVAEL